MGIFELDDQGNSSLLTWMEGRVSSITSFQGETKLCWNIDYTCITFSISWVLGSHFSLDLLSEMGWSIVRDQWIIKMEGCIPSFGRTTGRRIRSICFHHVLFLVSVPIDCNEDYIKRVKIFSYMYFYYWGWTVVNEVTFFLRKKIKLLHLNYSPSF